MADLTYKVLIKHKSKGIGFCAKDALQNSQRQGISPIKQAKFSAQATGSQSELEVTISDTPLRQIITAAIDSSGRMPKEDGVYSIEGVELQKEGDPLEGRMKDLQRQYGALQRQLTALRDENAKLRQDLTKSRVEVNTPLEGLLAYFGKTSYSPAVILEDVADLDFARRVFGGDIPNTFVNYANHVLGESLSEKEIETFLAYEPKDSDGMAVLRSKYEAAKKELDFLERIKSGETDIPETLRSAYIQVIEAKGNDDIIKTYESKVQEQEITKSKQETLSQLKKKYDSFSEQINLLTSAGEKIPIIFDFRENGVDLYLPFNVRDVKAGFIEDLRKEVETYFEGATVEFLENKSVAYRVNDGAGIKKGVDHMVEDVPVALKVAGFNAIVQYRLG